jgi:glycosyltransferase involved in cell wall biosynthesis
VLYCEEQHITFDITVGSTTLKRDIADKRYIYSFEMNGKNSNFRILIVNYEFPPLGGGGGVATYDLAVEWIREAQVDVLTSSFRGLPKYEIMDNINVYRVKIFLRKTRDEASFFSMFSYLPMAFFKAIQLCRKNHYDVINTHFAVPSGPLGYVLGKLFEIPNVLSLHGGDIYDPSKKLSPHRSFFFRRAVRFLLNRADRIVAQSSNTRDNAFRYYQPEKDISIIPLAFHPPELPRVSREDVFIDENVDEDDFLLITVGRLIKRKAIDTIIRSLQKINYSSIKLLIIGDGPERGNLMRLVEDLSLNDRVIFLGYVSNEVKYRYLAVSNLFVLTSLHEGFGIVFMESMYCGLPIVCTNSGGQVDFLKNGENAILIDVGDADACAEAIVRFYEDRELYSNCSINNKKKVMNFYAENIANQYIKLFNDLREV